MSEIHRQQGTRTVLETSAEEFSGQTTNEEQVSLLVDSVKDYAIIMLDPAGRIVSWNQGAQRIEGYSATEILGRHVSVLYPPEDVRAGKPKRELATAARQGRHEDEGWRIRKDGARFWASVVFTPLRDPRGALCGFANVTRDFTGRMRKEQALRESSERFPEWFHSVHVGVVLSGPNADVRICNQAALDMLGLTEDQLMGKTSLDPEWKTVRENGSPWPATDRPIPRVIATGLPVRSAVMGVYRPGIQDWVWLLVDAQPRLNADGSVNEVICCFADITDRKHGEEELRASERRFRGAFANAATGMALTDLHGRFLEVNRAYCEIVGYTEQDLAARSFLSVTHPEDAPGNMRLIRRMLAGEIPSFVIEKRDVRKDGKIVWVRGSVSLVRDSKRQPLHIIALVEDITERKQAAESLRQLSGRLLQLQDEERRRLARDLHESTAQTLAALGMNLGVVSQSAHALDAPARYALQESLILADQCIRELRTYSYLLHPPLLDELGLSPALVGYVNGFRDRSGIRVDLQVPPDLGRLARDVELVLFRIVQESLTNIHRHSGSRTAAIRIARLPDEILMEVKDEGHGILGGLRQAEEPNPQIGVGIASMKERVRQLGGRLEISSRARGTQVQVVVPISGN